MDKKLKDKIQNDWLRAFPQLALFSPLKLYKVVGPFITGIQLIRIPGYEMYRPHFVIYSLWAGRLGQDLKAAMGGPILLIEYRNKRGVFYDIPYDQHDILFSDVIENVKRQNLVSFEQNWELKDVLYLMDEHSKRQPLSAAPNSFLQAALQESKFKTALYISREEALPILNQIEKRSWDVAHFELWGIDVEKWQWSLRQVLDERDNFLEIINRNRDDKSIAKLVRSELIK